MGLDTKSGTEMDHRVRNRVISVVGGLGVVAILLGLGYLFSASSVAQQVASSAQSLHEANAAAGSTALSRASAAQAVVFSIDYELGVASEEARDIAIAEASKTLADTRRWTAIFKENSATPALGELLEQFSVTGEQVVSLLVAGSSLDAERVRTEILEPLYGDLASSLGDRQETILAEIRVVERSAGTVGLIARLAATLLIPAIAIVVYFLLIRRQFKAASVKMEFRIRAERDLSLAKDEFLATISHELRTPLTSIYGFSEYLLETEASDPEETMEMLGLINKDSAELSRMVDDLLTAARLESDALSFTYWTVDLRAETEEAIEAMVRSGGAVSVRGGARAWADPIRVRQIVRNLVSNAIKHGGSSIGVHIKSDGDFASITISDNGEGLTPEIEQRLFDRFVHDGDESLLTGSVGLGLSIARSLARTMGGEIRFVREDGWTRFVVVLPAQEGASNGDHAPDNKQANTVSLDRSDVLIGRS